MRHITMVRGSEIPPTGESDILRVLVLGSSGVVGSSLVKHLRSLGHDVVEWDILLSPMHDLSNAVNTLHLKRVIDDCDFVYFLAFDVGGSKYLADTSTDFINRNLLIMMNTFSLLERKKFVFTSSQMSNMSENSYGVLKLLGEHYTRHLGGISVRYWNVYGPEEFSQKSHVIPDFIHAFKTEGEIKMMTTGAEQRQFLHTRDCARAMHSLMVNFDSIKTDGREYVDITSFEWTSIKDIAIRIAGDGKVTASQREDTTQTRKNEPDEYMRKWWQPEISLDTGLRELMEA